MRSSFRSTDLCARLGGDEFVVLLTGATKAEAETVIRKFCSQLHDYNVSANRSYALDFSYGLEEFLPNDPRDVESLLAAGDAQMYAIKAAKRRH